MRHAVGGDGLVNVLDQIAALEQAVRHVDRNRIGKAEIHRPHLGLACGFAQRPFGQRHDQPGFFGQRNEVARRHQHMAALPAHQRLGAHHARRAHIDLGLVMQHQFVALDGLVQGAFEFELFAPATRQLRAVDGRRIAPGRLGRVHRDVGIAQQIGDVFAVVREQRDAHAGGDKALLAGDEDRLAQGVQDALRDALGVAQIDDLGQQRHELIAAQAAHRLERAVRPRADGVQGAVGDLFGVPHATAQAARDLDQQLVTRGMTQGVVDDLEAVQVNQQQRRLVAHAPRVIERALGAPDQLAAVGQARQRIEIGQMPDAVFGDPAVGHILHDAGVADALPMLIELGFGLDVDDEVARFAQVHRHVDGQHQAVRQHVVQHAHHAAPLWHGHHAQQAAQGDGVSRCAAKHAQGFGCQRQTATVIG